MAKESYIAPLEKCVWKGGYWVNVYVGNIQSHHNDVDLLSFPWFFTTIQQSSDAAATVERWILFLICDFNIQYPLISISIDQLDFTGIIYLKMSCIYHYFGLSCLLKLDFCIDNNIHPYLTGMQKTCLVLFIDQPKDDELPKRISHVTY